MSWGVFVLGSGAVNQETQYFGPGTRLLVLGELGAPRAVRAGWGCSGRGCLGRVFSGSPRVVLLSPWLDFWNWQPVDRAR